MTKLKRLTLTFTLVSVFAVATFVGETPTMACAPGETSTPPCGSQSADDDSTVLGELLAPPASDTVSVIDVVDATLWSLSLF